MLCPAHASDDDSAAWDALRHDGIALIRHATAPGTGDPAVFKLGDCSTQRNLDEVGKAEATRIGKAVRAHGIVIGAVLASQWCRTHETALLAFPGRVKDEPLFNSIYDQSVDSPAQTESARALLMRWKGPGALVVVTHQVNVTALSGVNPASGEVVVLRRRGGKLEVVGRITAAR